MTAPDPEVAQLREALKRLRRIARKYGDETDLESGMACHREMHAVLAALAIPPEPPISPEPRDRTLELIDHANEYSPPLGESEPVRATPVSAGLDEERLAKILWALHDDGYGDDGDGVAWLWRSSRDPYRAAVKFARAIAAAYLSTPEPGPE